MAMSPIVSTATECRVDITMPGSSSLKVTFNGGAEINFKADSTDAATLQSDIDAITGCEVVSSGWVDCDSSGPAGLLAITDAIDLETLADTIRYEDEVTPPAEAEWHSVTTDDGLTFGFTVDPDDLETVLGGFLGEYTTSSIEHCRTLWDVQGNFVTCGSTYLDCECVTVTAPPTIREQVREFLRWVAS